MQIHLSPRHLRLTAAIRQHTAAKVLHLEGLAEEIVAAHIVLRRDEAANPSDRYSVKVHLAVPGPDIHAEENHADLYGAIDLAMDKLARQLRKRKTRLTDKRRSVTQRLVLSRKANGV